MRKQRERVRGLQGHPGGGSHLGQYQRRGEQDILGCPGTKAAGKKQLTGRVREAQRQHTRDGLRRAGDGGAGWNLLLGMWGIRGTPGKLN